MLKHVIINNARIVAIKNGKILEHNKMNADRTFKPYIQLTLEQKYFFVCVGPWLNHAGLIGEWLHVKNGNIVVRKNWRKDENVIKQNI